MIARCPPVKAWHLRALAGLAFVSLPAAVSLPSAVAEAGTHRDLKALRDRVEHSNDAIITSLPAKVVHQRIDRWGASWPA